MFLVASLQHRGAVSCIDVTSPAGAAPAALPSDAAVSHVQPVFMQITDLLKISVESKALSLCYDSDFHQFYEKGEISPSSSFTN